MMAIAPAPLRMTAEEFDIFVTLPENTDRDLELIDGRIVEVVSNHYSSKIAGLFITFLNIYVLPNDLGDVTVTDGGFQIGSERYIPDVAFVSRKRQANSPSIAYNPVVPDIAVEVLSPTNDQSDMRLKIAGYLSVGTTVWLVDPVHEWVDVFTPNQPAYRLTRADSLTGGSVLPGFALPLSQIFRTPPSQE
jgi:Uma2 family endonuclease